ncbi:Glutathione S-transferase protein [Quaeritorhiza haematococci]|nr:Glutathione S-transferase protein [Quaeritorhiza haematococci]
MPPTFYTAQICPFAHRVALSLHETFNNDPYTANKVEKVEIDLGNKPEWYIRDVNPAGKVPSFKVEVEGEEGEGGKVLVESLVIAEYVVEKYGARTSLLPSDPLKKAEIRLFVSRFGDTVIPEFYKLLKAQTDEDQRESTERLNKAFAEMDALLTKSNATGPFFLGPTFTFAEIATLPWIARLSALEHYRSYQIPSDLKRLQQWVQAGLVRESVVKTSPGREVVVQGYAGYANGQR